ncbi:MAG: bifunctional diguanylate cyclase/phosphodiesterase [Chloroflexota bacterium]|nr:bifunctional diguanylate cyclase/phosphodiesterase [Chloroflexota bacterium]
MSFAGDLRTLLVRAVVGGSLAGFVLRAVVAAALLPVAAAIAAPPGSAAAAAAGAGAVGAVAAGTAAWVGVRWAFRDVRRQLALAQQGEPGPGAGAVFAEVQDAGRAVRALAEAYRNSADALVYQAYHDPLTGLLNRAHFLATLRQTLREAGADEQVAVLFFDLDRFKLINDTLGHAVGDRLLVALSQRLQRLAAPHRLLARLAGDEFVLLIRSARAEAEAIDCARSIVAACARPYAIDGHDLFASASVGIAVGVPGRDTAHDLLRRADIALYRAKEAGRARFALFAPEWEEPSEERLSLEAGLRRAIARGQLRLAYQPVYRLADGALAGFEALLRWHHPHRGVLTPGQFLELAEETGEMPKIGRWVLDEAARFAAGLRRLGFGTTDPPPTVFVNLSASEFSQPELASTVQAALRRAEASPALLGIEITETVLMRDVSAAARNLARLREEGVRVAIDDFGTGYSSLAYLELLPVDGLKIDASFVGALGRSERAEAIVQSVVQLAAGLGLSVTAEGIETGEQAAYLRELGCGFGQGHYFAPPMERERLLRELKRRTLRRAG